MSGFGPGLVDKHQTRRINALLMASPAQAVAFDVRPILLARDQRLFLSVTPIRRKNRLIIDVSAWTPRSASNRSQSACTDFSRASRNSHASQRSTHGIRPSGSPRASRSAQTAARHLMAEASLTPNPAAALRLIPSPFRNHRIDTRSRKSANTLTACDRGFGHGAHRSSVVLLERVWT